MKRKIIKGLFVVYILGLIYVLFLHSPYRFMGNTWNVGIFSKEHIEMANFVPLRTVSTYFTRLGEHSINTSIVVMNLSVNLLLLAPMAVFVKVLFSNKINKFWKFLLLILCLNIIIEILQFLTFSGSLDIDDIILNTMGACITYGIMSIKYVENFVRKMLKLEE